ncbi:MAG: 50S ribosomal protein L10 [Candidatus Babeliales bacterium]
MNRQEKESVISHLRQSFQDSSAAFLVQYQGLTVDSMQALRKGLRENKGELQVAKARLMRRAAEGLPGAQDMLPLFKNQVGLVFAYGEFPAIAKVLYDFTKDHKALMLVGGTVESQLLNVDSIKALAMLPSRNVLLAQLCGTLQAPISTVARLIKQIAEQKEGGQ